MDPRTPLTDLKAGSIFFVGTATTVIRCAGFTVLTDPSFLHAGRTVRLGYGLRTRRRTDPALEPDDLPPLDLVVLSHLHEDHWDRVAERSLSRHLPIVTTPGAARHLARKGFRSTEPLRTWRDVSFWQGPARLRITSLPARHGPPLVASLLPETMGSLLDFELDGERLLRLYVSGDTLVHRRFPDIDLALLHLGGTRIGGVLLTMNDRQGVEAMRIVRPRLALPIHHDDYPVFRSPLEDFQARVHAEGLDGRVHYLLRGESFDFRIGAEAPATAPGPWGEEASRPEA